MAETTSMLPDADALAERFTAVLREWLKPEEWQEMRRRNVANVGERSGICASHDFCDANMAMDEAWEELTGASIVPDAGEPSEAAFVRWGEAWDIAKARHLTGED